MHIGLIGGIGPAATDYYYRRLIATMADRKKDLQLTIAHADTPTLLNNLATKNKNAQVEIFALLTKRLAAAGAETMAVTSIAGHFCIEEFKAVSALPVIDILQEVSRAIDALGFNKVGILGTNTAMETRFYGGVKTAEVIAPAGDLLAKVHQAYVDMAASGKVNDQQHDIFVEAGIDMITKAGAEAIMLGGTDLVLAFDDNSREFQTIDCAGIHVDAIAELACK